MAFGLGDKCAECAEFQKHWKIICFSSVALGRPPDAAPDQETGTPKTLEKHWKMNGNCYTANGGVLVLVNGGVPDTLYNLQLNKRWTLPLCD